MEVKEHNKNEQAFVLQMQACFLGLPSKGCNAQPEKPGQMGMLENESRVENDDLNKFLKQIGMLHEADKIKRSGVTCLRALRYVPAEVLIKNGLAEWHVEMLKTEAGEVLKTK